VSLGNDFVRLIDPAPGASDATLPTRIKDALIQRISSGAVAAGTRLPTIRQLAQSLGVNPMTVAKAYKALADLGYVESRGSGGTFARMPRTGGGTQHIEAANAANVGPAVLSRQLFSLARAPGVIGFTTNYPDPKLADVAAFRTCLGEIAADNSMRWFRYDPATGRDELRYELVRFLARRGIISKMEEIIVTAGGQQALDLVARAHVMPGDAVVVERPTYFGGLNVLRAARARVLEVPLQPDGLDVARFQDIAETYRPRLLYINPTFHNPSGVTTSLAKRQRILEIARRYGIAILEDDHCPELRFAGEPVPSFKSLADPSEPVFYAAGFGKSLIPGIRLGFLLPPLGGGGPVTALKATTDLQSTAIIQGALALYLERGSHVRHIPAMLDVYRKRQRILLDALRKYMPEAAPARAPDGGLSLWITLPARADLSNMYFLAAQSGVAFASGDSFVASSDDTRHVRLSFGLTKDEDIPEGVRRLATVVSELGS